MKSTVEFSHSGAYQFGEQPKEPRMTCFGELIFAVLMAATLHRYREKHCEYFIEPAEAMKDPRFTAIYARSLWEMFTYSQSRRPVTP